MSEPPAREEEATDPDDGGDDALRDRFSRTVAIATVVATLLAAMIGYADSVAGRAGDEAGAEARRTAVRNVGEAVRVRGEAQVQFDRLRLAEEERRRAADALQQRVFGVNPDVRLQRARERGWLEAAVRTERGSLALAHTNGVEPLTRLSRDGPARDRTFPDRYFARAEYESNRQAALRDAAEAEAGARGSQATKYTVMLTMIAVAVYLFGFSLTPHAHDFRRVFAGLGGAVALAAGVWAAIVTLSPVSRAPSEAARAYADAVFAASHNDAATAFRGYDRAIHLRPDFAKAYLGRAQARFVASTPQKLATSPSLAPLPVLRAEVRDLRRARELGSQDPGLFVSLGFAVLSEGISGHDDGLIEEGMRLNRTAARASPADPVPIGNIAVAQLALGHMRDAMATYLRGARVAGRTGNANAFTAGALTDIELVAAAQPTRGSELQRAKELLVERAEDGLPLPSHRPVPVTDGSIYVSPAYLELEFSSPKLFTSNDDRIAVEWYHRDPGGLGWSLLEQISGYAPECGSDYPAERGGCTDSSNLSSTRFVRVFYPASTRPTTCLPPGDYRAEVHVNGRIVETVTARGEQAGLSGFSDPDVGMTACAPSSWRPARRALPGLVNGLVSPDGRSGLYVVTVNDRIRSVGGSDPYAVTRRLLDQLVKRFPGLLPPVSGHVQEKPREPFLALDGELVRVYSYRGGVVVAGAGIDHDGVAHAGLTFGPRRDLGSLTQMFESISLTA